MAAALLLLMLLVVAGAHEAAAQASTTFSYDNFLGRAANELLASGDAQVTTAGELWLTGDRYYSYGRVMKKQMVQFCNSSTGHMASFSTDFTFVIKRKDPNAANADGFAFLIAPDLDPPSDNTYGRWLGLFEPERNGMESNNLVALEFDTFKNYPGNGYPEFQDIDDNHVGVDVNGIISINSSSLGDLHLGSGSPIAARITYNAPLQMLQVYVSTNISFRNMGSPVLQHSINLCAYVNSLSYVGFSGGAGSANVDFHIIRTWKFSSSFSRIVSTNKAPAPGGANSSSPPIFKTLFIIAAACALLLLVITIGCMLWRVHPGAFRRSSPRLLFALKACGSLACAAEQESQKQVWLTERSKNRYAKQNLVLLPHEMSYSDIAWATQNFSEHNLLGKGGFGSVYRGVLPEEHSAVAVKRISKTSHQGEREFLAEVQIISKLSHKNLVKLRGWCKHKKELILVYEYMQQGSVDQAIFGKGAVLLLWETRFKIICGLASALVYIHEEWEHQVIHRDIKLSNVMLDTDFNARLGDFGLARVIQQNASQTTVTIAGTVGYIAPEVGHSYKFTPASDTYSFGVVALEMVCGKKAIDSDALLLPWLEKEYEAGRLLNVVDPRLGGMYNAAEVVRVLHTALMCVENDPNKRPTMRQVLHLLKGLSASSSEGGTAMPEICEVR